MNPQNNHSAAADAAAREGGQGSPHYLYIVARDANARSSEIFIALRRDMSGSSVELIYDRRTGERRHASDGVDQGRRQSDRRCRNLSNDIAAAGWTRVQID